jgi:hypothetical protein
VTESVDEVTSPAPVSSSDWSLFIVYQLLLSCIDICPSMI